VTAVREVDVVVIGASMRGLVAAFVAGSLGKRTVLVDASPRLAGGDGSFVTGWGDRFDHGLHVLDFERSPVATDLFTHVVDGCVHRVALRRAVALRGQVMPYAPDPADMPEELRAMLGCDPIVDDVGDDLPSRDRLGAVYGPAFADFVFDEVLASFPSEARHRAFGVDEALLVANVYPWFFPRAEGRTASSDESRAFHDLLRSGVPQEILYPEGGGFGGFAEGFAAHLEALGVEVCLGVDDLDVVPDADGGVRSVIAGGGRLRAGRYLWGGGWPALCGLLGLPCQDAATDRVVVGSMRLDRPAATPYHEILVGDPTMLVNRIHFPARFRESDEPLLQVEFAYPLAEPEWERTDVEWVERWTDDCRRLGILTRDHRVECVDVRGFSMHFNAYGAEGVPLRDADPSLLDGTNVHAVVPSMANLNLNRWVPRAVDNLLALLDG